MKKYVCPSCESIFTKDKEPGAFPFCSSRCQLLDLGGWVEERYSIPDTQTSVTIESESDQDPEESRLGTHQLIH